MEEQVNVTDNETFKKQLKQLMDFTTMKKEQFSKWKIVRKWKKVLKDISDDGEMNIEIETIQQFMRHPDKAEFIDWKDDGFAKGLSMLYAAVYFGRLDIARLLLENGADSNTTCNAYGETVLMRASSRGHINTVKLLLEKGADITIAHEEYGWTTLMYASMMGHTTTANILLEKGADMNTTDEDGMTALMLALERGHNDTARVLLEKGADVNISDKDGMTALSLAIRRGHTEIVNLILDKGADVNIADKYGVTALMHTIVHENDIVIAMRLTENGADVHARNSKGKTALHLVCEWSRQEDVKRLFGVYMKYGAEENVLQARSKRQESIVQLLLSRGANVKTKDNAGETPLHIACKRNQIEVVWLLVRQNCWLFVG